MRCDACNYPYIDPEFRNKLETGQTICDLCKDYMNFHELTFEQLRAKRWLDKYFVESSPERMKKAFRGKVKPLG